MISKEIKVNDYITKSKLPDADYVINPYVGCPHKCRYCYASFMKRFTNHLEPWGDFIDIKRCDKPLNKNKLKGKKIFLSSVTDCYNPYEKKYCLTRNILKELVDVDCELSISTKSALIVRDLDILTKLKNVKVAFSINTLSEDFKGIMDNAASITARLTALKKCYDAGIYTILFMSPIFPLITDYQEIIESTKEYVSEYWFEDLNLRGPYKKEILKIIKDQYPQHYSVYENIYINNDRTYFYSLGTKINEYCEEKGVKYKIYFDHALIKKK